MPRRPKPIKIKDYTAGNDINKEHSLKDPDEWKEVEELIRLYKRQFDDPSKKEEADSAMTALLERFYPLFKKYLVLIKSAQINFGDPDSKRFVLNFIGDPKLKMALKQGKQSAVLRNPIYQRFHFVTETYGRLSEDEIMEDLHFLFMELAYRYKYMGKSFAGYLYNAFCYEVARHIKKFIANPANIHYRNEEYEDCFQQSPDDFMTYDKPFEDKVFETNGVPNMSWIQGVGCSEEFDLLSPIERKILVKYYLEEWTDQQIADSFGMDLAFIVLKKKKATERIADILGLERNKIKEIVHKVHRHKK